MSKYITFFKRKFVKEPYIEEATAEYNERTNKYV